MPFLGASLMNAIAIVQAGRSEVRLLGVKVGVSYCWKLGWADDLLENSSSAR